MHFPQSLVHLPGTATDIAFADAPDRKVRPPLCPDGGQVGKGSRLKSGKASNYRNLLPLPPLVVTSASLVVTSALLVTMFAKNGTRGPISRAVLRCAEGPLFGTKNVHLGCVSERRTTERAEASKGNGTVMWQNPAAAVPCSVFLDVLIDWTCCQTHGRHCQRSDVHASFAGSQAKPSNRRVVSERCHDPP